MTNSMKFGNHILLGTTQFKLLPRPLLGAMLYPNSNLEMIRKPRQRNLKSLSFMYLFNQSKLKSLLLVVISLFIVFLVSHTYLGTYFVQITINSPGDDTSTMEWPFILFHPLYLSSSQKKNTYPILKILIEVAFLT